MPKTFYSFQRVGAQFKKMLFADYQKRVLLFLAEPISVIACHYA